VSDGSARAALGRTPIPGERPTGSSVAEDADFEALRAEVLKDPLRGESPNWIQVVALGTRILSEKSKDVVVATYLALGLLQSEGFAGLADGLQILEGLLQEHWEQAFPPVPARLRARSNALLWLSEKAALGVARREPAASEREALGACAVACEALAKVVSERFAELPTSVGDLTRALRDALERLPEERAAAVAATAAPLATPAQAAGARPSPTPAATPAATEIRSRSDAELSVLRGATFLRQQEPNGAAAYRVVRALRWDGIMAAPPAGGDGRTQIPGPAAERATALERLHVAQDWPALLESAEAAFRERPLWLDPQRLCERALAGLGPSYGAAREAVLEEVRGLLSRVPGLARLAFQNGTPFADAETRRWIEQAVTRAEPASATRPAAEAAPLGANAAELAAARDEARALAKGGRLGEALGRLETALAGDVSARGRFLVRLELATLCSDAGHDRVAAPLLEALDSEIARFRLEEWDPALSASVLRSLYRCRRRLADRRGAPPEEAARAEEIFGRLCRLDPVLAAALE